MNSLVLASLSLPNLVSRLPGGVAQGIIWGIMALGVYITFRLLDVADLTVDGSFTTGGAVTVMLIIAGWPAWAALLAAVVAGLLAGLVTGLLHTKLGIPAILAGILTQFALYSINLRIMSMKANTPVNPDKYSLFLTLRSVPGAIWKGLLLAAVLIALLYWYFGTEQGSAIRATGANPAMSRAQGININAMKVLGLSLSNGMVALSGGLMAQYQGFADINMGRGAIVIGLAAVIIGEVIFGKVFMNFGLKLFLPQGLQLLRAPELCHPRRHRVLPRHGAHPLAQARPERSQALHRGHRGRVPGRAVSQGAGQELVPPPEEGRQVIC